VQRCRSSSHLRMCVLGWLTAEPYEAGGYAGLAYHDAWTGDAYINPSPTFLTPFLASQKSFSFSSKAKDKCVMCAPPHLFQNIPSPF